MGQSLQEGGDEPVGSRPISRRTVLRTAAHSAWAAPLISAVSAAPAFAAASDALLFFPASTGSWNLTADRMTASVPIKNASSASPTVNLLVTATLPSIYVYDGKKNRPLQIANVTGGWKAGKVSYSGTGSGRTATVVFTATTPVAAGATSTLGFTARLKYDITSAAGADSVTLAATATGFTGAASTLNPS